MFGSQAQWLTDGDNHRSCKLTAFKVGSTHFNNCGRDFVTAVFLRANDHIGGYAVAAPIFAGIESKFGLRFPKFRENMIWHTQLLLKHTSNTHSYYWLEAYHSDMKAKHEYMAFIENCIGNMLQVAVTDTDRAGGDDPAEEAQLWVEEWGMPRVSIISEINTPTGENRGVYYSRSKRHSFGRTLWQLGSKTTFQYERTFS